MSGDIISLKVAASVGISSVAREDGVRSCPRAGCGKSARPVVCPAKAGMFSRRKACRGNSQKPR